MFGRNMFQQMDQDPFFEGFHQQHHVQMDQMFQRPFTGMLEHRMPPNVGGRDRPRPREPHNQAVDMYGGNFGFQPFGFGNIFQNMNMQMQDMNRVMAQSMQNGQGHSYSQSSFMSYSNTGNGPPKVYQASSSTRQGPGGVRETRKAVRDSEREMEKMAIGHHIRDRGHEVQRSKNTSTGNQEEIQNFHNIDEHDAENFDREWQDQSRDAFRGLDYDRRHGGRRDDRRAVQERRSRRQPEQLALPDSGSEDWGKTRDGRNSRS